jgi:hypothetical protein
VQKKQKKAYATRKEKHIFEGSQENPWLKWKSQEKKSL